MRDFHLFTAKEVFAKDCLDSLQKEIKNVKLNGEADIWIDGKSRSFIWFDNARLEDFFVDDIDEFCKKIPIKEPYANHVESHRSIDVKRILTVLMKAYPELYVYADDNTQFFGTAQEYIDTEFDY